MKTEKINPKGERKAGDRKKQGRRYFKPSNKKSENIKNKNNSEKELNNENSYLKECQAQKKRIRGILVAPSLMEDAREMIEEEGIEFVSVEPPRELKRDKKVTLDAF